MVHRFPYQPDYIFNNAGEIDPDTILSRRDQVRK
jgi:NagD protein